MKNSLLFFNQKTAQTNASDIALLATPAFARASTSGYWPHCI